MPENSLALNGGIIRDVRRGLNVSLEHAGALSMFLPEVISNAESGPDPDVEADPVTEDESAPELQSATVDGSALTLSYDETLDNSGSLSSSLFAVTANGTPRTVLGTGVGGSDVTLLLSPAVAAGDTVAVSYTAPAGESDFGVQDTSGNAAESFSGQEVTNSTASSSTARSVLGESPGVPTNLEVSRQESGKLKATWGAPSSGSAPTGYTVQWKESGGDWAEPNDVSETQVTKTSHIITGLTDGTEYTVRVMATRDDVAGDPSGEVGATPGETTLPALSTAAVDGAELTLTFNEALDSGSSPDKSAFAVTVGGASRAVATVSVSGSAVTLTLVAAVSSGESVSVSYTVPTGETDSRLQDLVGNPAESFSGVGVSNSTSAVQANSPATGTPAIEGTFQVGRTLTVSTSNIDDDDGKANAVFAYRWIASDGTDDADILDATGSSYTLLASDVGKTIRVEVSFTDDAGHPETVTSGATDAVAAAAPGSPGGLAVSVNDSGKLDLSWNAPSSDGGSAITGYKVQWKDSSVSWDTSADVSETTVSGTGHTVSGLTDGVEYAFRVIAVNPVGDSAPSAEMKGAPRETTAPTVSSVSVNGATLTIAFDEALDGNQTPGKSSFQVTVAGNHLSVDIVEVSGDTVTLTLVTSVFTGDAVTVAYTAPSGQSDAKLQDPAGNAVSSFSGQETTNNTPAAARLTASISSVPGSHDGLFTFELRFSENLPGFSYKTLRDHAFTVTGGQVTRAKRLDKTSNIGWMIDITSDGNGRVTAVLPVTTDCTAPGAICTWDRRPFSKRVEVTVPGPGG